MKELQPLLEYIDSYSYIDDEEEIVIRHSPWAAQAQKVYDDALRLIENTDACTVVYNLFRR